MPFFKVEAAPVTAVALRGDLSVWTCRRSEIGSHLHHFHGPCSPDRPTGHFHENGRSGSHADRTVCWKRGHSFDKSPRLAATAVAKALTLATHPISIDE
ncbi:MAG TPA: hypothetical protein VMW38_27115 [Terriglobia bacterium]|nr:hypothetical protein [Terriglobia bacterium]